jgi:hypothetical protein
MTDIGNHLQPDAVYNCEQIGTTAPAAHLLQQIPRSASAPPISPAPAGICPKLPPGSASILSANVTETISGLVKVKAMINVSKVRHPRKRSLPSHAAPSLYQPTAAGAVELRLLCPPLVGDGMDVVNPKCVVLPLSFFSAARPSYCNTYNSLLRYNAGLPAGVSEINFEFTATSDTFSCSPEPCPGTYGMKLSVCELECEDSKHAGHAGEAVAAAAAAAPAADMFFHSSAFAVLDVDNSLTFTIPNNS